MPSPDLVAAIDAVDVARYDGLAYGHQAARWNPLSGAGARSQGGRWNPPQSFSTLYLAMESQTAVAEFHRMAKRSGRAPHDFMPRRIYRYELRLASLVDLRQGPAQAALGLTLDDFGADDPARCQAIGEAAQYLGREGIIATSASGRGAVVAVFFDRLEPDSLVQPIDYETWDAPPKP